jgi:hypothetical protein
MWGMVSLIPIEKTLWLFGIFSGPLVYFPSFGTLYREKSGNPELKFTATCSCRLCFRLMNSCSVSGATSIRFSSSRPHSFELCTLEFVVSEFGCKEERKRVRKTRAGANPTTSGANPTTSGPILRLLEPILRLMA